MSEAIADMDMYAWMFASIVLSYFRNYFITHGTQSSDSCSFLNYILVALYIMTEILSCHTSSSDTTPLVSIA